MRYAIALVVLIACIGIANAGELHKGENEVALRASYSDIDLGSSEDIDLGSVEDIDLSLSYGWLLTDNHELGLLFGYIKEEIDGGDLFDDSSVDGTRIGAFYSYNFSTSGMLTPYVGAALAALGGDMGDAYDFQYGIEAGLKIYPFEHGGVSVGLGYSELRADAEGLPDASGINLGAGLLIKY